MARPQMETGVEHHSQSAQHSCRMEVQRPETWPGVSIHTHQNAHPNYPTMDNLPRQDDAHPHPLRAALLPHSASSQDNRRTEHTDQDREHRGTTDGQPLPGLLPLREPSPQASAQQRAPGRADQLIDEEVVERVAHQLRRIGDDLNATILQRAGEVPQWQDWRGLCSGLVTFLSDTLRALFRLR
ncbi:hypothetical protein UPYG_G00197170 [Umbra pygmaea]|uniref:BCL2 binding component 3 n=1 Tax=Umbra pygmaea TaxID=75934 RepID=A0ABD0WHQ7_UMBPY